MAELHRFQDKIKTPESRAKPIQARDLDENFDVCRTDLDASIADVFQRNDNFPKADTLGLKSATSGILVIQGGKLTVFPIPDSGSFYVKIIDGEITFIEPGSCVS